MSVRYQVVLVPGWLSESHWDYDELMESGVPEDNIFDTSPMGNGNVIIGEALEYLSDEEYCMDISKVIPFIITPKPTVLGPWKYGVWLIGRYV